MAKEVKRKVEQNITPDLYHLSEDNSNKFYKIPKELCDNPCYRINLTSDAKLIYAMLLDRMELSRKNNWINEANEIYLLFTKENVSSMLGISETTVYRSFKQLESIGLIKQVRQGLNKPNMIFIGKIKYDFIWTCQICSSGPVKCKEQDISNLKINYTKYKQTKVIETENNYNGAKSNDIRSTHAKPDNPFLDEAKEVITYYFNLYQSVFGYGHPRLKKSQFDRVLDVISSFMSEYSMDADNIMEMANKHFDRNMDTDYNINHFATDGILVNLHFECGLN